MVVVGLGVVKIGGRGGGPLRGGSRILDLSVVLGVNLEKGRGKDYSDIISSITMDWIFLVTVERFCYQTYEITC